MSVEAKLKLQIGEFTKNYDAAAAHAKKRSKEMEADSGGGGKGLSGGVSRLFSSGMARLGGVAAIGAVALESLSASMKRQSQVAGLTGVSLENVSDQIERLEEMAKLPGLGFDQALQGSIKLQAVGLSAAKAEATIAEMGNALALVGGGSQDLEGVILAITQIISKGKVSAEEINQIAERLPQVRSLMKEAFGTADTDALQKMGIESEVFIDGLVGAASGLTRASATSKTELENLKDAWKSLMVELGSGPEGMLGSLFAGLSKGLSGVESWVDKVKTSWTGLGQWMSDFSAGGIAYADEKMVDRDTAAAREKGEGDEILAAKRAEKEADDARIEDAKKQSEAREKEKEKAEDLAEAFEKIADITDSLEDKKIDLLPDDEQLAALKEKLQKTLDETVGMFGLNFETSAKGLKDLLAARMADKTLPDEGQNSALEAAQWLKKAEDVTGAIAKTEERIAAEKKKATDEEAATQERLAGLRADAEEGAAKLLSPEDQAKRLRDQLSDSLGIDISGAADVAAGLQRLRTNAEMARINGDTEGEAAALKDLQEAQAKAAEFAGLAKDDADGAKVGGRGTVAGAIANIFGRSSSDLQLDESKAQTGILANIERVLNDIHTADRADTVGPPLFRYP